MTAAGHQWKQQINQQAASSRDSGTNRYAWLRNEHPESDVTVVQSFRPIGDIAQLAQGAYFQLAVMTSPKPWQVSARCSNGVGVRVKSGVSADAYYPNRAPFDALAAYAGELNLPHADLSEALMKSGSGEANYLRHAPRWSSIGHRQVAENLTRFLVERVPGPWNSRYFQHPEPAPGRSPPQQGEIQQAGGIR